MVLPLIDPKTEKNESKQGLPNQPKLGSLACTGPNQLQNQDSSAMHASLGYKTSPLMSSLPHSVDALAHSLALSLLFNANQHYSRVLAAINKESSFLSLSLSCPT